MFGRPLWCEAGARRGYGLSPPSEGLRDGKPTSLLIRVCLARLMFPTSVSSPDVTANGSVWSSSVWQTKTRTRVHILTQEPAERCKRTILAAPGCSAENNDRGAYSECCKSGHNNLGPYFELSLGEEKNADRVAYLE